MDKTINIPVLNIYPNIHYWYDHRYRLITRYGINVKIYTYLFESVKNSRSHH